MRSILILCVTASVCYGQLPGGAAVSSKKSRGNPPVVGGGGSPVDLDFAMNSDPWIPDFGGLHATKVSQQNGNWDDTSTWGGAVPLATENVQIQHDVTIRNTSAAAKEVGVAPDGKLIFKHDVNTKLEVQTVAVLGELEIGTSANPVDSSVTAEMEFRDTAIDTSNGADPAQYGNGLLATGTAVIRVHGASIPKTFLRTTVEPSATDTTLTLSEAPTGWKAGDRIVIPDTRALQPSETHRQGTYNPQWETLTIDSIATNVVTITGSLAYDHDGAYDENDVLETTMLPHVANLNRNVIFSSENTAGTRGHVLFGERADVDIRYALFKDLGRTLNEQIDETTFDGDGNVTHVGTNQIARYAIHMHHLAGPVSPQSNGRQWTIIGCSVDMGDTTPEEKWHTAIHASSFGLYQWNTHYNCSGSCVVTEDGSEIENQIHDNFVCRVESTDSGWRRTVEPGNLYSAREATGFWFRGMGNYVRRNVATNILTTDVVDTAYGFKYMGEQLRDVTIPASQGEMPPSNTTDGNDIVIPAFEDNEVYGATESGFTFWWVGTTGQAMNPSQSQAIFDRLTVWNVHQMGWFNYMSKNILFRDFTFRSKIYTANFPIGATLGDYKTETWTMENFDIQGAARGLLGTSLHNGPMTIRDSHFATSKYGINVVPFFRTSGAWAGETKSLTIENCTFTDWGAATPDYIVLGYFEGIKRNYVALDQVFVIDFQGNTADDFQLYYEEQDDDYITPASGANNTVGSPEAGQTNQQNWTEHGVAIAGEVVEIDDLTTRAQIDGYLDETWVQP